MKNTSTLAREQASHSGRAEDFGLPECDSVSLELSLPKF